MTQGGLHANQLPELQMKRLEPDNLDGWKHGGGMDCQCLWEHVDGEDEKETIPKHISF